MEQESPLGHPPRARRPGLRHPVRKKYPRPLAYVKKTAYFCQTYNPFVTITLNLPEAMTRFAVGDDEMPTRYLMQVIDNGTPGAVEDITDTQGTTRDLYITHSYEFLFWADRGEDCYTATDLQDIRVADEADGTMGIAYRGSAIWNGTDTAIDVSLDFAVCKITLVNTTSTLWRDNSVSVRLEKAYSSLSAKSGVTGTAAPYTYTEKITADIAPDKDIATFYALTKEDEEQDITVLCNDTEIATASAKPSPGQHLTLRGNIGGASQEPTASVVITVAIKQWADVSISLASLLTDATKASTSLAGEGTPEKPFLIQNAADLKCYINDFYTYGDSYVRLESDIEITSTGWTPIEIDSNGTFDGGGHTISGEITVIENAVGDNYGLFGVLPPGAAIQDLEVSANISAAAPATAPAFYAGGIAANLLPESKITNCTYSGTLTVKRDLSSNDEMEIGGIAGRNSGTISGCTFSGTIDVTGVTGVTDVGFQLGGIAVNFANGTYSDCDDTEGKILKP